MAVTRTESFAIALAVAGLGLAALGVAGARAPYSFSPSAIQSAFHAATAGAGALLLVLERRAQPHVARGIGVVLLGLAGLGALSPGLYGLGALVGARLEWGESALHAALGAWGVWASRQREG